MGPHSSGVVLIRVSLMEDLLTACTVALPEALYLARKETDSRLRSALLTAGPSESYLSMGENRVG